MSNAAEKKEMVKIIRSMARTSAPRDVFKDFVKLFAYSIANATSVHDDVWEAREKEYMRVISQYDKSDANKFSKLAGLLTIALEKEPEDVLGEIFMDNGLGNDLNGQFFTPYDIDEMMARLTIREDDLKDREAVTVSDPACGSAGMLIAARNLLAKKGFDFRHVEMVAQDIDWTCVYMAFIQLSLLGVRATVVQGDTLAHPYDETTPKMNIFRTPAYLF